MAICRAYDVKLFTDIESDDIHDTQLNELIEYAWEQTMNDTGIVVHMVKLDKIDNYRKNTIDGSNKTFYIPESWTRYIGDWNYNQSIDAGDMEVWEYKNDYTREERTVSSINGVGDFTLSAAPSSGSELYVNYMHIPLPITNKMYKTACIQLTAAMAYGKLNAGDYKSIGFRGLTLNKMNLGEGMSKWLAKYKKTISDINHHPNQVVVRTQDSPLEYPHEVETHYSEPNR